MPSKVVTIIGNPKPKSRTFEAADLVVHALIGREPDLRIDLVELGAELLDWSSPTVARTVEELATADLAIIASPTYKATYTGLLKIFLDTVGAGQLATVTAVPLMLAADPRHALAGEVHLKPVLNELGASCPTPSLFLRDDRFNDPAEMSQWLSQAQRTLGSFS